MGALYAFTSGYGLLLRNASDAFTTYILGLLNSKVLDYYLKQVSTSMRGGFFRYFTQFVEQLPIRSIDPANAKDRKLADHIAQLVDRLLALYKQLPNERTPYGKTLCQNQIQNSLRQVDELVYELYDLTAKEIEVIEGDGARSQSVPSPRSILSIKEGAN